MAEQKKLEPYCFLPLVNWAVCPLHAVLSFLFPPFPITLILFSTLLFMGGNMLLSNFQLN